MKPKLNELQVPAMPADYADEADIKRAVPASFPNLKQSTETISLRLPLAMLNELKRQANQRDVPYQSYLKTLLAEALRRSG